MPRRRGDGRREPRSGSSSPPPEQDPDEEPSEGGTVSSRPLLPATLRERTPQQRFRGGPPPATPSFTPDSKDPQAFRKWERKVQVWKREIGKYMDLSQAGLRLYGALSGDVEE